MNNNNNNMNMNGFRVTAWIGGTRRRLHGRTRG
jgi:hypothetical protein